MGNTKKRTALLLLAILLLTDPLLSLDLNLAASAELNAANGLCLLVRDPAAILINPALVYPGISTATTNLYSYPDLFLYQISAVKTFQSWGIAVGGNLLDHLSYREISGVLTGSKQIRQFRVGLNLRYLHNSVENYYNSGKLILDTALSWSSDISTSTFVYKNVLQEQILGSRLPTFMLWETSLRLTEEFELGLGLEKQQQEKFIFKLGTICRVHKCLDLLISCQQEPARLGAGFSLKISQLKFSYAIRTHQHLPYTHSLSLAYEIPGN